MSDKPLYLQPIPPGVRTYGTVRFDDGLWKIRAAPQVTELVKRLFPGSRAEQAGEASFPATKRTVGELNWLMLRYPLQVVDADATRYLTELSEATDLVLKREEFHKNPFKVDTPAQFQIELMPYQKEGVAFLLNNRRSMLADTMGLGKAQPVDSKVLTPAGWVRIGDIKVGDIVVRPKGGTTRVTGVFPQGKKPVFRVQCTDESETECCDEHLWEVNSLDRKWWGRPPFVRQLMDIRDNLRQRSGNLKHYIPLVQPMEFDEGLLPLNPYLLGVLLGDGGLTGITAKLTSADAFIVDTVKALLPSDVQLVNSGNDIEWRISRTSARVRNPVKAALESLDLMGKYSWEKRIPDQYKFSSIRSRLAMLRGLMDTDGCVCAANVVEYVSTSKQLATDVLFLVRSLGGTATFNTKTSNFYTNKGKKLQGRKSYRLVIAMPGDMNPFRLPRKADVWKPRPKYVWKPRPKYQPTRAISSVTPAGTKECVCISVDSEEGLYVTDDFIVTHNTATALGFTVASRDFPALIIPPPHVCIQWVQEINKFLGPNMRCHIVRGTKPYMLPRADFYIIHYLLLKHWFKKFAELKLPTVIFDEAQELRHHTTDKYSAASLIAEKSKNCILLSGTPIHNRGAEIWSVLNIAEYHCLGDRDAFTREYCTVYGGDVIRDPEALGSHLRESGLFLRRTKEEVLPDLPPKRRVVQEIGMDEALYGELVSDAVQLAKRAGLTHSPLEQGRLIREAVEASRQATGIAKAPLVADFVELLLDAEEPLLLFAHHHAVMDEYKRRLRRFNPVEISGRATSLEKAVAKDAFQNGHTNLALISMRSGTGLNMDRARAVVFGELDWSPAVHAQCEDRSHRMTSKNSILAYYLVAPEGSDREIQDALGLKVSQFVGLMGDKTESETDKVLAMESVKQHMKALVKRLGNRTDGAPAPSATQQRPRPEIPNVIQFPRKARY